MKSRSKQRAETAANQGSFPHAAICPMIESTRKYRILSVDGGGIRGIVPARWLRLLSDRLAIEDMADVFDQFDLFAGTSTGALIAAGVSAKVEVRELVNQYFWNGSQVFPREKLGLRWLRRALRPKYRPDGLRKLLCDVFEDRRMCDLGKRTILTSFDPHNRKLFIFDSEDSQYNSIPVWQACMASAAAPTYFPPHQLIIDEDELTLLDGGLAANNPTCLALSKAVECGYLPQDIFVVSMGTGEVLKPIDRRAIKWGELQWALPIISLLFDGGSGTTDAILRSVLNSNNYVRLQVNIDKRNADLDNASDENISQLKMSAVGYLKNGRGRRDLQRIIDELKSSHPFSEPFRRNVKYQTPSDLVRAAADNWDCVLRDILLATSDRGGGPTAALLDLFAQGKMETTTGAKQAIDNMERGSSYADRAERLGSTLTQFEDLILKEMNDLESVIGALTEKLEATHVLLDSLVFGQGSATNQKV